MKKFLSLLMPIMLIPTLSACQDTAHSVIQIKTSDNSFTYVELGFDQLCYLIDSKQDFILETYSPNCSHCMDLVPLLDKYSQNNDVLFYRINMFALYQDGEKNKELNELYPDIFQEDYVPTIKYITDAKLTYQVSSNKFGSYSALERIMNKHKINSNIEMVNTLEAATNYKNKNKNYLVFAYDLNTSTSLDLASHYLITREIADAKKNVLLINTASFAGNLEEIKALFGADSNSFSSLIKDGEIKRSINYLSSDGSNQLLELVSAL